jgi:hypothetical protein
MLDHIEPPVKAAGDVLSLSAVVAALIGWAPSIAAFLTVVWTLLRIIESIQTIIYKRRQHRDGPRDPE